MKVLSLNLSERVRPIFWCYINDNLQKCLFDTGANISVFTGGRNEFLCLFEEAILKFEKYQLSGFGGDGEICSIYVIPSVTLRWNDVMYTVHDMLIAVFDKEKYDFKMILSPSLFTKYKVEWIYQMKELNIYFENTDNFMEISIKAGVQVVHTQFIDDEPIHPLLRAAKRGEAK